MSLGNGNIKTYLLHMNSTIYKYNSLQLYHNTIEASIIMWPYFLKCMKSNI